MHALSPGGHSSWDLRACPPGTMSNGCSTRLCSTRLTILPSTVADAEQLFSGL